MFKDGSWLLTVRNGRVFPYLQLRPNAFAICGSVENASNRHGTELANQSLRFTTSADTYHDRQRHHAAKTPATLKPPGNAH